VQLRAFSHAASNRLIEYLLANILLELLKAELLQRQENNQKHRIKAPKYP